MKRLQGFFVAGTTCEKFLSIFTIFVTNFNFMDSTKQEGARRKPLEQMMAPDSRPES